VDASDPTRPASILVACNPHDADEIVAALTGEPDAPAIVVSDGGNDAVGRFVDLRPEVVVVAATLDAGDARMLISALRGAAPAGTFHVVLVGDARGPVRNALDAADFVADRFVARPLSPKALRYAITSGIATARRGRLVASDVSAAPQNAVLPEPTTTARPRLSGAHRAVMITPPGGLPVMDERGSDIAAPAASGTNPGVSKLDAMLDLAVDDIGKEEVQRRTSTGFAIPMEAILAAGGEVEGGAALPEVTAPMSVHDLPTRPVSDLEARRHALSAVTSAADSASFRRARTSPPPPPQPVTESDIVAGDDPIAPAPASSNVGLGEESGSHELPPGLEPPVMSETHGSFDDGGPDLDPVQQWPAQTTADLPREDEWDAPPMPVREPTMILTGNPPTSAIDVTERSAGGRWAHAPSAMPDEETDGGRATAEEEPDGGEVLDDGDLDGDLAELSVTRPIPIPPEPPPSGGDFARELRKKMSLMAQRLFRAGDAPAAQSIDARLPHDFRTEIDLAEIDASGGGGGGGEVYDADVTFAGDDHGLPTSPGLLVGDGAPPPAETAARTAESGEIARGSSDAAVLIARMFVSEFTGQVVLRRERGEKVIYFDGGRPVFASSDHPSDRMGELLFREGKITHEQYERCRDLVLESGRRMGEILVDKGFLKRRELLPAVRRHVEDIIYSLFAWDTGEYRIVPGDGASLERIRLSRHPAAMVLEGVRRKLDLGTLERLLGPATTVVEVADRDKAGTVISVADLSLDERGALTGMDGSADLAHVARATGAALVTVYQLAWAMTLLGVATVRRRGGDDDDAPALVGETDLVIDRERVRARHRLVDEADYFALLGVRRDATGFEIRRAYEAARRDFDADAFPPELRVELTIELAEIHGVLEEAFRVLRDDRLRGMYLSNLAD